MLATTHLAAWILSLLTIMLPPERYASIPTYPEAAETTEERQARYADIAWDIATVSVESSATERGQKRTAAVLLGIAWHESGFAKDVDMGPCAPARLANGGCDSEKTKYGFVGRAKSLWQIRNFEVPDRKSGARIALRLVRRSLTACRRLPQEAQLAAYASGTCESPRGQKASRELWAMVKRFHP